jgi:hypothetical protein
LLGYKPESLRSSAGCLKKVIRSIYVISDDVLATKYEAPSFLSIEFFYPTLNSKQYEKVC